MQIIEYSLIVYFFYYIINYGFRGFFLDKITQKYNKFFASDDKVLFIPIYALFYIPTCAFCTGGWIGIFLFCISLNLKFLALGPLCLFCDIFVNPDKYRCTNKHDKQCDRGFDR
jgi:hypothetical protein